MGAVNYFTSDYITMAIEPYSAYDLENDQDFMREVQEQIKEYGGTLESCIDEYIESNFPVAFDGWEDKRAAQREITSLKKCLLECAGVGMVQCSPGWCTGYNDYKGTCKAIGAAIKAMRDEVKNTPTWTQYKRESA